MKVSLVEIFRLFPRPLRNWLRDPAKTARYLWSRVQYAIGIVPEISLRPTWNFRCHPASRQFFEVFRTDPLQREELDIFVRHCRPGMRLLDVGAHYGLVSLAATHFGGPSSSVVCVEASPRAAEILQANIRLNALESRAAVAVVAMGSQDGTVQMLTTGPFGGDYCSVPATARGDTSELPQMKLDTLVSKLGYEPTHVKIDVEGFENEVLLGSRLFLASHTPVLFIELHGDLIRARGEDPRQVLEQLESFGYECALQNGTPASLVALESLRFNVRMVCSAKQKCVV
jgi:FkbM family methyltransferase